MVVRCHLDDQTGLCDALYAIAGLSTGKVPAPYDAKQATCSIPLSPFYGLTVCDCLD